MEYLVLFLCLLVGLLIGNFISMVRDFKKMREVIETMEKTIDGHGFAIFVLQTIGREEKYKEVADKYRAAFKNRGEK